MMITAEGKDQSPICMSAKLKKLSICLWADAGLWLTNTRPERKANKYVSQSCLKKIKSSSQVIVV